MSKHHIIRFTTVEQDALHLDASHIQAVMTGPKPGTTTIVTSSDTYGVEGLTSDIAQEWKDAI